MVHNNIFSIFWASAFINFAFLYLCFLSVAIMSVQNQNKIVSWPQTRTLKTGINSSSSQIHRSFEINTHDTSQTKITRSLAKSRAIVLCKRYVALSGWPPSCPPARTQSRCGRARYLRYASGGLPVNPPVSKHIICILYFLYEITMHFQHVHCKLNIATRFWKDYRRRLHQLRSDKWLYCLTPALSPSTHGNYF